MNITSYYFVSSHKKNEFQHLLSSNKFLAIHLEDYSEGYTFYYQFVFNIYTFLTTDDNELILDDNIRLDYPFQFYIHEMMIKQRELYKFKKLKGKNHLLCLLASISIKNKLKHDLHKLIQESGLKSELPLELINLFQNSFNATPQEQAISKIHDHFLTHLKEQILISTYFQNIIKDSIDYAKRYYNLLQKEF